LIIKKKKKRKEKRYITLRKAHKPDWTASTCTWAVRPLISYNTNAALPRATEYLSLLTLAEHPHPPCQLLKNLGWIHIDVSLLSFVMHHAFQKLPSMAMILS
jgi:hypothetical protein